MKFVPMLLLVIILVAVSVLGGTFYIVDETQQVVITQFGKPVGQPVTDPGLHMKLPFVQQSNYFEKRFQAWDGDPNQIPTKDKRFIWVDTYARWRIVDPLLFFQRLRNERGAQSRLDDILDGGTRNVIAKHELIELIRLSNKAFLEPRKEATAESIDQKKLGEIKYGRETLAQEVLTSASKRVKDLGIEILDFEFKRINYVEEVRKEVYARMISERKRIAEQYRSEGAGEAAKIDGQRQRELKKITSEAYRKAQIIKGRADAKAADLYAAAYSKDPEFYQFIRSMESFRKVLDANTTVVLSTDGDLLEYLQRPEKTW